eukprot:g1500.t1
MNFCSKKILESSPIVLESRTVRFVLDCVYPSSSKSEDKLDPRGVAILRRLMKQTPLKRHHIVKKTYVDPKYLKEIFPKMKAAFHPQEISFNHYKNWKISTWMEVEDKQKQAGLNGIESPKLLQVMTPVLNMCDLFFKRSYEGAHGKGSVQSFARLQSFVTRYRALPKQAALLAHVDGRHIDGSIVLGLPTDLPFEGGGLTVWDGLPKNPDATYYYPMAPGDICFLNRLVWHQAEPITSGERWALVIFYRVGTVSRITSRPTLTMSQKSTCKNVKNVTSKSPFPSHLTRHGEHVVVDLEKIKGKKRVE